MLKIDEPISQADLENFIHKSFVDVPQYASDFKTAFLMESSKYHRISDLIAAAGRAASHPDLLRCPKRGQSPNGLGKAQSVIGEGFAAFGMI